MSLVPAKRFCELLRRMLTTVACAEEMLFLALEGDRFKLYKVI